MAKKQTRRSVSVSREMYSRLQRYSDEHDLPMSEIVSRGIELVIGFAPATMDPGTPGNPPITPVPRVKSTAIHLQVSSTVAEHVEAVAGRIDITPSSALDTGVNRMIDRLEQQKLCRACLQATTECECA